MRIPEELLSERKLIIQKQRDLGYEYYKKLRELEADYHQKIADANDQLSYLHSELTKLKGENDVIVRVEYYNTMGQACDTDALWIGEEPPKLHDQACLWDNVIHCVGKYSGRIKMIYDRPGQNKYRTYAVPFSHKKVWSA